MSAARGRVRRDDDRVRVSVWSFRPDGAATGQHLHELDDVVPLMGGTSTVTGADGSVRELVQTVSVPYRRAAGTAHDVASPPGQTAASRDSAACRNTGSATARGLPGDAGPLSSWTTVRRPREPGHGTLTGSAPLVAFVRSSSRTAAGPRGASGLVLECRRLPGGARGCWACTATRCVRGCAA